MTSRDLHRSPANMGTLRNKSTEDIFAFTKSLRTSPQKGPGVSGSHERMNRQEREKNIKVLNVSLSSKESSQRESDCGGIQSEKVGYKQIDISGSRKSKQKIQLRTRDFKLSPRTDHTGVANNSFQKKPSTPSISSSSHHVPKKSTGRLIPKLRSRQLQEIISAFDEKPDATKLSKCSLITAMSYEPMQTNRNTCISRT